LRLIGSFIGKIRWTLDRQVGIVISVKGDIEGVHLVKPPQRLTFNAPERMTFWNPKLCIADYADTVLGVRPPPPSPAKLHLRRERIELLPTSYSAS
jgi:hypothetical protein